MVIKGGVTDCFLIIDVHIFTVHRLTDIVLDVNDCHINRSSIDLNCLDLMLKSDITPGDASSTRCGTHTTV